MSYAGGPGHPPHQVGPGGVGPGGAPPGLVRAGWSAGKVLGTVAAAVVAVVGVLVVVVIAPWSDTSGTDMSTDEDGNDVATLTVAFHPGWEIESEAAFSHPGEALYEDMREPPDTVTWVGLDLDAGEAVDLTMRYLGNEGIDTQWEALPESAEAYAASQLVYRGGEIAQNPTVEGTATYVTLGAAPPADLNDLENRLALEGGALRLGDPDGDAMWGPEPGRYLGFTTAAGSTGYLQVQSVRQSTEEVSGHDAEPLDLTVQITYLSRP